MAVLDYLLRNGSEGVVLWTKDNIHLIRTLNQFEYVDDDGRDQGKNIRDKAKDLVDLVSNETQLKQLRLESQERRRASRAQADPVRAQPPRQPSGRSDENDAELQLALEASMQSALEEEERRKQLSNDDDDLKKAIQLSKQEESKHGPSSSVDLFGTSITGQFSPQQQQQPVFVPSPVDLFGSPTPQQPYPTASGYSTSYHQSTNSTGNTFPGQLQQQQQLGSPGRVIYGQQQPDLFGNSPVPAHFTGSNNPFNQITATSPPAISNSPFSKPLDSPTRNLFDETVTAPAQSNSLFATSTAASVSQPLFETTTSSAPANNFFSAPSAQSPTIANNTNLNSLFDRSTTTQANSFFAQSPTTTATQQSNLLFESPATTLPFASTTTPAFSHSQSPFASPLSASQAQFQPPLPPKQAITNTGNNVFGAPVTQGGHINPAFSLPTMGAYDYNNNVNPSAPASTTNTFQTTNTHNPFMPSSPSAIPTSQSGFNSYVHAAPTGYGFGNVPHQQQPSQPQQHQQQQPTQSLIDL
jgi:epsin